MSEFEGITKETLSYGRVLYGANPCVYVLWDGDEIVYVGKSNNGLARIWQHPNMIFSQYSYIEPCDKTRLNELEATLIYKFTPKYNKEISSNKMYLSKEGLKTLFNVDGRKIRHAIKKNGIDGRYSMYPVEQVAMALAEIYGVKQ